MRHWVIPMVIGGWTLFLAMVWIPVLRKKK